MTVRHSNNIKIDYAGSALCFIAIYFVFQIIYISFISQGAGLDDAELASNVSFWTWGYGGSQPPLYTWLAFGLTKIFGLSLAVLQVLKFSLLASTFFAVYIGLRLLYVKPTVAAAAMLGLFLLPQIGWESQRALTHSIMGTAGSAWSFAAFAFFWRKPNYLRGVIFGITMACAILGKYNGTLFLIALLGGAFLCLPFRSCLKTRWFLSSLVVTFICLLPAAIFMLNNPAGLTERANKLAVGHSGHFIADRFSGLADFGFAVLSFCFVALIIAIVLCFLQKIGLKKEIKEFSNRSSDPRITPSSYLKEDQAYHIQFLKTKRESTDSHLQHHLGHDACVDQTQLNSDHLCFSYNGIEKRVLAQNLISSILLFGLCCIAAAVLILGITTIKDRWLQPLLFLSPAYFTLLLARLQTRFHFVRIYGIIGVCAALIVPFVLYINIATTYYRDKPAEQLLDYSTLYRSLTAHGSFDMILGYRPQLPGNLRLIDPSLKTLHKDSPLVLKRLKRPFIVLWEGSETMPEQLVTILKKTQNESFGDTYFVTLGFKANSEQVRTVYFRYYP
ncbi:ArnT family glycosyltransferase [Bartonella tamiae]|nr:glycosyltransferase family 39 protein [Bartonella tamiae]